MTPMRRAARLLGYAVPVLALALLLGCSDREPTGPDPTGSSTDLPGGVSMRVNAATGATLTTDDGIVLTYKAP